MTAAIFYHPEGFDTSGAKLMGRHAAGEGFLKGLFRHGTARKTWCFAASPKAFEHFKGRARALGGNPNRCQFIPFSAASRLAEPGVLSLPDPNLAQQAWNRRFFDPKAYSLCGVTHTTASQGVMDQIGSLLSAPVEPWDALICTSKVVKNTVMRVLAEERDFLVERFQGSPPPLPLMPVIPLGVDCDAFPRGDAGEAKRKTWRERLGIGPEDVAALFMGRLSFHAKAHPLPAYLGLEEAAQRNPGRKVHFIQAGWFANDFIHKQFVDGAKAFAPSVTAHFVDGRKPDVRTGIWAAGDLFLSLSDNVQETFGLTPVEAMAAGLPVVASDWDGYRDTVRHGAEGFMIPTLMPPPGSGEELIQRHVSGLDDYDRYIGNASQSVAVDVRLTGEACARLVGDAALRKTLGEAGRRRAREAFDWSVIIQRYEELWIHLNERRREGRPIQPRRPKSPAHPRRQDPFALFASYPTGTFRPDTPLLIAREDWRDHMKRLGEAPFTNFADASLLPMAWRESLLTQLAAGGEVSVGEILEATSAAHEAVTLRTLGWLYKTGLVRLGEFPS